MITENINLTLSADEQVVADRFIAEHRKNALLYYLEHLKPNGVTDENLALNYVKYFVFQGADVNAKNKSGVTPLHFAARKTGIAVVEYLVLHGADVHAQIDNRVKSRHDGVLDVEEIERLLCGLSISQSVSAKDKDHDTPLHWAAHWNENVAVTQYLISQGANIHAKDKDGYTPLHRAACNKNVKITEYLVSQGADVHAKTNFYNKSVLHMAAEHRNVAVIKYLVSQGVDVNAQDYYGSTPLHAAAWRRNTFSRFSPNDDTNFTVIETLVSLGADVNAKSAEGDTPLHVAATRSRSVEVITHLVSQGADVNAENERRESPLQLVAEWDTNSEVTEYLVSHGADVNARNEKGENPLHRAWACNNYEVAKYLLSHGADVRKPQGTKIQRKQRNDETTFEFEDIVKLHDVDVRCILLNTEVNQWALALKGANEELKEKIFNNMSKRATTMLQEEIEYLGPQQASEIERVQQDIVDISLRLEDAGEILLRRSQEEI